MSKKNKPEETALHIESDADFIDYCLELATRQGRVQKKGNLASNEAGTYIGDVTYHVVLN